MNETGQKFDPALRRHRYLIHLCFVHDAGGGACRYVARTQLWTSRKRADADVKERTFSDEYELIATINPLLPLGSDVRNVISHIESPDGFLYLLQLNHHQASLLGWRP